MLTKEMLTVAPKWVYQQWFWSGTLFKQRSVTLTVFMPTDISSITPSDDFEVSWLLANS